jgi:hypothetical protein
MAALSTIHDVTGRRLVSLIYSCDIYDRNQLRGGGGTFRRAAPIKLKKQTLN